MRSLKRGLAVVAAISQSDTGLSLQELATRLDVPPASMHRLLAALEDEEVIVRSPCNRRYFISPSALTICAAATRTRRLQQIPPGPLARAAVASGQTVFLTEMIESTAVCVALAAGRRAGGAYAELGRQMPWHAAASARVLLLDVADERIIRLFDNRPLQRCAVHTPTSPEEVLSRVQLARRRGYDLCDDELDSGKWGVSVPIRDESGRIRQAVTLIADTTRTRRQTTREGLITLARHTADELAGTTTARSGIARKNYAAAAKNGEAHLRIAV
jgi:DNA-binding IclR family transcriptional regulator